MHFQVKKSDLLDGVRLVEKAISTNNTLQIIAGIELNVKKDALILTANNLDIAVQTKVPCHSMKDGTTVLEGKLLSSLVRKLPDEPVIFEMIENQVIITAGTTEFALNEIIGDEFPIPPKCDQPILSLTDYELRRLANCTLFAVAHDDQRPVLAGVLLEIVGKELHFVSTDSNRLSFAKAQTGEILTDDLRVIIPNKSLSELLKCLPMDETMVNVSFGQNQLAFSFGDTVFTTRLVDGQFPNYKPVLYTEQSITITMKRQQLLQAIDRAALFDRGGSHPVLIQVTDGVFEIGINTELGKSSEQFNVEHAGENGKSAYSPRYIMEMLRSTDSDEICFKFEPGPRQALIKPADNEDHLYILMPIRI